MSIFRIWSDTGKANIEKASQVVRLVLRHAPEGKEGTYRIPLDQIPPVAAPGTVRIALRLSIPVFAEPSGRALPHVQYHVRTDAGQVYLIGTNDGDRHTPGLYTDTILATVTY